MFVKGSLFFFLIIPHALFTQNKIVKKVETAATQIHISTVGLDDLVIENTSSKFTEVTLYTENLQKQHIVFSEGYNIASVRFSTTVIKSKEPIFRKYITKRLNGAYAVVKVPISRSIAIFGDHTNVTSKGCKNALKIDLKTGVVKLNVLQDNLDLKMYAGTVYGILNKATVSVISNLGIININNVVYKKAYEKSSSKALPKVVIKSVKANIFLTTK